MLVGKDKVVMEGYTIYRNDRNGDGGGVLIAIKDVLKGIIMEESNSKRKEESIWLSLTNNRSPKCAAITGVGVDMSPHCFIKGPNGSASNTASGSKV